VPGWASLRAAKHIRSGLVHRPRPAARPGGRRPWPPAGIELLEDRECAVARPGTPRADAAGVVFDLAQGVQGECFAVPVADGPRRRQCAVAVVGGLLEAALLEVRLGEDGQAPPLGPPLVVDLGGHAPPGDGLRIWAVSKAVSASGPRLFRVCSSRSTVSSNRRTSGSSRSTRRWARRWPPRWRPATRCSWAG
jgi:hypothetical protein